VRKALPGLKPLGYSLKKVAKPFYKEFGFFESSLLTDWEIIVGKKLADIALPEKLTFAKGQKNQGTLFIRTSSAGALELQHREPLILERINSYFGYLAIKRLHFVHKPLPLALARLKKPKDKKLPPLNPELFKHLEEETKNIQDPLLAAALLKLGQSIYQEASSSALKKP